jgi:hypothetical protein
LRIGRWQLPAFLLLTLAACAPPLGPTPGTLTITGSTTLSVGETAQLTATDSAGRNVTASATWSSSNANIATVSTAGRVLAVAVGTATMTAAVQGASASVQVNVR